MCGALVALALWAWHDREATPSEPAVGSTASRKVEVRGRAKATRGKASSNDVVRRLLSARSVPEIRRLSRQLATVGDDAAIDAVAPLLVDPRRGVSEAVLGGIAGIGSERAIDTMIACATNPSHPERDTAIELLGRSGSERAAEVLLEIAGRFDDDTYGSATAALGELGTPAAIEALTRLASTMTGAGDYPAIAALAAMDSPEAQAALRGLVDSPLMPISTTALDAITYVDASLLERLEQIVASGRRPLLDSALRALAHAGDSGLPILIDAALHGPSATRRIAALALSQTGSADAADALAPLLADPDTELATAASMALAQLANDAGRDALIAAAIGEGVPRQLALARLIELQGPQVESALVDLLRVLDDQDRALVLTRLVQLGNDRATEMAIEQTRGGDDATRSNAIAALGASAHPKAAAALLAIARDPGHPQRQDVLRHLAESRRADPAVHEVLRDALRGDATDVEIAASALGRLGTTDARDALVELLGRPEHALVAIGALQGFELDERAIGALSAAAARAPELAGQALSVLVATGASQGLDLARRALASSEPSEIHGAVEALAAIGSPEALDLLEASARSGSAEARARAISALGERHDASTLDTVREGLYAHEPEVRAAAASAVASVRTPEARDALLGMARSSDADDRLIALQALHPMPDEHVYSAARQLLTDRDARVGIAALEVLVGQPGAPTDLIDRLATDPSVASGVREYAELLKQRREQVDDEDYVRYELQSPGEG